MASKGRGYRTVEVDGYEVLVGKGARENDELTFGVASPRDVWLHAAGYAGATSLSGGRDMLAAAAARDRACGTLAAWYSKARDARGRWRCMSAASRTCGSHVASRPGRSNRNWDAVRVYPKGDVGEEWMGEPGVRTMR